MPTTTTTTTPATTTTTTTVAPLSIIKTSVFKEINGQFVAIESTDSSDNEETIKTAFSESFTFGTLSPGETSNTLIINLNAPYVAGLASIQISLIDAGGITFANNIFGVTSSTQLSSDIVPTTYFQGINQEKLENSPYNISINTRNKQGSEYVYQIGRAHV